MDKDDRYTRITLRIPRDLHQKLADAADDTSKSMNAEIVARLQESFERPSDSARVDLSSITERIRGRIHSRDMDLVDALDLQQAGDALRLRVTGATYDDADQILTCLAHFESIRSVTLAVRDGEANFSALSVVIRTDKAALVADSTYLTAERGPRLSEIRDIIWSLDLKGLLGGATRFRATRVEQTEKLPAHQAAKAIEEGEVIPLGYKTLPAFLNLFTPEPVARSDEELYRFFVD